MESVLEIRNLTPADDYCMEIELLLVNCPHNLDNNVNTLNLTEKKTKALKELGILD